MKRLLSLLLVVVLMMGVFVGCTSEKASEEAPVDSGEVNEVEGTEDEEVTEESEENLWKKEPMYGKTITIGYNGGLCTGAPGVAKVLGYYEAEGVDVEIVNVQAKVDAIGTNQVQMTTDHIATLLVPTVNGINMVFTTGAHTGCKSLYVLNNDEINTTADLIGKVVAVPDGIGNSDHNIGMRFFNKDNIDPREVTFRQVEASASILSMENGEVQGVVLSDQFAEGFVEDGTLKVIRSLTFDQDFANEPCCVHAFNKTFVEENPITAKKMTKAVKEASIFIGENIEEATQILFDNNWASGDFDQACRMMDSYDWAIGDELAEVALKSIIDDYKSFGLISEDKDTEATLNEVWNPLLQK